MTIEELKASVQYYGLYTGKQWKCQDFAQPPMNFVIYEETLKLIDKAYELGKATGASTQGC